jgi:hypothetical protein
MRKWFGRCRSLALFLGVLALLLLPVAAYAQGPGSGELTSNGTDPGVGGASGTSCASPTTVAPDNGGNIDLDDSYGSIYLDIVPIEKICTAGGAAKLDKTCSSNDDCTATHQCNSTPYTCGPGPNKVCLDGPNVGNSCSNNQSCGLACNGGTHDNTACTDASQCTDVGVCEVSLECSSGDIELALQGGGTKAVSGTFNSGNGTITACVDLTDTCLDGHVTYCGNYQAAVPNPPNTETFIGAKLTGCGASAGPTSCMNTVGSLCCGLTQGAYGAWNSVATCQADNCNPIVTVNSKGWIPALFDLGVDIFDYNGGNSNATTIGLTAPPKSVSIGTGVNTDFLTDLSTLVAYLPATTTAGKFNGLVGGNVTYNAPGQIPDAKSGGSKGEGGGVLSGNGMACGLNVALSGTIAGTDGTNTFTPSGFGGFQMGALVNNSVPLICTRRSGEDKILGTSDDVCQAFQYPNCVAGLTVSEIKADADAFLSTGISPHGCTASDLNVALDNINNEFDQCGEIIDCTAAGATGPGTIATCPALPN